MRESVRRPICAQEQGITSMKRYALCIGVNDHDDPQINGLFCACNDADEVAFTLRQQGVDATTMTRRVSADAVYRYLRELGTKLTPGDVFIFFFAGHGKTLRQATGQSDQLFLLPDASAALLAQGDIAAAPGLLSWNVLKTLTDSWTDVKRLFVFDACRLSLDSASMRDTGATVQFEGEGVFRDFKLARRTPLQGGVGLAVLNSCTDGQQAEELRNYPGNGHGLLTAALLELVGEASKVGAWLATDSNFAQRLTERMQLLGQRYGAKGRGQTPLLVGEPVPLVLPRETPAELQSQPPPAADEVDWLICCAKGRLEDFEAFARQHPRSQHQGTALERIRALFAVAPAQTQAAPPVKSTPADSTSTQGPSATGVKPATQAPKVEDAQARPQTSQSPVSPVHASEQPNSVVPPHTGASNRPTVLQAKGNGLSGAKFALGALALGFGLTGLGLWNFLPSYNLPPQPTAVAQSVNAAPAPAAPVYAAPPASRFRKLEALLQVAGCEACGEMSRIEAGGFEMGAAEGEAYQTDSERPLHRVTLKSFEIGRTELTQGQWKAVMSSNPSHFKDAGDAWPVEHVSWNDVQEFLKKLNQQTGGTYRLPSEAEWEFAARAGTSSSYWWGNSISKSRANYSGDIEDETRGHTVKADSFEPNPWGLYNVHGNVYEWVQDVRHSDYQGAPFDGNPWEDGFFTALFKEDMRIRRGGYWGHANPMGGLRSAARNDWYPPRYRHASTGFRIARSL